MSIDTAMVLAAGLGTRMRPLTLDKPKALVRVAVKALIDHVLDRLVEANVRRAVVNVHAFADMLEAHVRKRDDIEIVISDERARLMETGGGLVQARALLGEAPIFVCNIDSVWEEPEGSAMARLARAYDRERMDGLLMLADFDAQLGYDGAGDFFRDACGRISFRDGAAHAPHVYMGVQALNPSVLDGEPLEPFSLTRVWRKLAQNGRLYGAPLGGYWMHVGDPNAREAADARVQAQT